MRIQVAEDLRETRAVIKVIGIGGAGGNAINRMAEAGIQGVELIAANSDAQDLRRSQAEVRIQVGERTTKGLGVGGDPAKGRMAMLESEDQIREVLDGADLVFITAGMGGGTGTGGASAVAAWAKDMGALTIGVVTKPFDFEKLNRANIAEQGILDLRQNVDTLLVIPNQRLLDVVDSNATDDQAYRMADDVLKKSIQSISDVITTPGQINMDLNDIRAIMKDAGEALIGMGEESGKGRAIRAAKAAIHSPLLENVNMDGAKGLIVNITGRKNMVKLSEIEEAMALITGAASPDAKIKMGKADDESLGDSIRITVIATGFPLRRGGRNLLRAGLRASLTGGRRPLTGPFDVDKADMSTESTSSPDDWSKPAFMRLKVRKLK
ncbi:MAG: cell division protein FtsZ [Elusimicrobia bacterium]|nr:cell division protein FtsZ [Elusimicrobiota bacterium]